MKQFIDSIYLQSRFIKALVIIAIVFALGFAFPFLYTIGKAAFFLFITFLLVDLFLLYSKKGITGDRYLPERFSNGDENKIEVSLYCHYGFKTTVKLIEEFPVQFQFRDDEMYFYFNGNDEEHFDYGVIPTERGEYIFGHMNVYATSPIGIVARKYLLGPEEQTVAVYPSFIQQRKFEFLAHSNQLTEYGVKKIRKIGQNMEFDQIRDYVKGDDYRIINWKATARQNRLMVNQYQDEKSQQIYNIIDKGRAMKMPFNGLTLLDHAINASLVMSSVAMLKDDKAGLITFSDKIGSILKAQKNKKQLKLILDSLYNQKTRFQESDFERLYKNIRLHLTHRSLILLYTNFESMVGLRRQVKYLRAIAKHHELVIIFFENEELKELTATEVRSVSEIYLNVIGEKFCFEKKQIAKELNKLGIQTILTTPQNLSVDTINKYLELKSRSRI